MNRVEFDDLVESIERQFQDCTDALEQHTRNWLLLGYASAILITVLLIGSGLALFLLGAFQFSYGIFLIILGAIFITLGLREIGTILFIETKAPEGFLLSAEEAPELFKLVENLLESLNCPPVNRILVTDEYNASIAQHPRLGIFGWPRSWLILGLPLLLGMSLQEFTAVLVHECAHLSKYHGRLSTGMYQMHQYWEKLMHDLQTGPGGSLTYKRITLMGKFLAWYWPRYHARAFVLSRQNEYFADRVAADATSPEIMGNALYRIATMANMLDRYFWKDLWDGSSTSSDPPNDFCFRLKRAYRQASAHPEASRWCDLAAQEVATNDSTHPSLSDRLHSIGLSVENLRCNGLLAAPEPSAAEVLFKEQLPSIEDYVNNSWRESVMASWNDRFRKNATLQNLVRGTKKLAANTVMEPATLWNQTRRLIDAQGVEAAEPNLKTLLSVDPEHLGATVAFGQVRVLQGHDDGEELLQDVLDKQHAEWSPLAGTILETHFTQSGRRSDLKRLRRQLDDLEHVCQEAEKERNGIRRSDIFLPHDLSEHELSKVRAGLSSQEESLSAWLAQKKMRYRPDEKLFVLCVDVGKKQVSGLRNKKNNAIVTRLLLQIEVPGRLFVVNPTGEFRAVAEKIMKMTDGKILDASMGPAEGGCP